MKLHNKSNKSRPSYGDAGCVVWRNNAGKWHRTGGPACEYADGSKEWWVNDKRHRLDGPAIEYCDGEKEWWVDGKIVTEEQCNLLYSIMKLKGLL